MSLAAFLWFAQSNAHLWATGHYFIANPKRARAIKHSRQLRIMLKWELVFFFWWFEERERANNQMWRRQNWLEFQLHKKKPKKECKKNWTHTKIINVILLLLLFRSHCPDHFLPCENYFFSSSICSQKKNLWREMDRQMGAQSHTDAIILMNCRVLWHLWWLICMLNADFFFSRSTVPNLGRMFCQESRIVWVVGSKRYVEAWILR